MRYFLLLLLLLSSCAKPNIEVDSSELEKTIGAQPIGLIEVTKANGGGTLGISFTETLGESLYCTGTLLSTGEVVTSMDCLQNKDGSFRAEQMFFHVHLPGNAQTKKVGIASIRADAKRNLAYLRTKEILEFPVVRALSIRSKWEEDKVAPSPAFISGTAVSVASPDKHGKARVLVSLVKVQTFFAPVPAIIPEDSSTNTNTNTMVAVAADNTPAVPKAAEPAAKPESPWAHPHTVTISGLKDLSFGSPIFYQNDMVGFVKSGDANLGNGQWIVGD
jgi:hypothetical protein